MDEMLLHRLFCHVTSPAVMAQVRVATIRLMVSECVSFVKNFHVTLVMADASKIPVAARTPSDGHL
jgi:hypothetical protein